MAVTEAEATMKELVAVVVGLLLLSIMVLGAEEVQPVLIFLEVYLQLVGAVFAQAILSLVHVILLEEKVIHLVVMLNEIL